MRSTGGSAAKARRRDMSRPKATRPAGDERVLTILSTIAYGMSVLLAAGSRDAGVDELRQLATRLRQAGGYVTAI